MDRREFFESFFSHALKHVRDGVSHVFDQEDKAYPEQKKVRPPGASVDDNEFRALCIGCDACMIACPIDAIMIEDLSCRYPLLYPEVLPCVHCTGYPCIQACESDALSEKNGFSLQTIE